MELQAKRSESNFHYPKAKLFPQSLSSPSKQRQITHFPQLRGRTVKTYLKLCCFKTTFLKLLTEEYSFHWNVHLVTLSKNLVATITEFQSIFVTATINIYIEQHVLYPTELKIKPITLFFSQVNIILKLLRMCICDKQRQSFNRIYKQERSKYLIQKNLTNVHALRN